jgi:hypothetical protein
MAVIDSCIDDVYSRMQLCPKSLGYGIISVVMMAGGRVAYSDHGGLVIHGRIEACESAVSCLSHVGNVCQARYQCDKT